MIFFERTPDLFRTHTWSFIPDQILRAQRNCRAHGSDQRQIQMQFERSKTVAHASVWSDALSVLDVVIRTTSRANLSLGQAADMRFPRLNFSAQNDVRVGLQWEDFLGKCSSKFLRLFGLHWASKGVKWCKSEGVKDKLTLHSYIFFGVSRGGGVKRCKSWGVIEKLPPNSYIVLPPLTDQKRYIHTHIHEPSFLLGQLWFLL